MAGRSSSGKLYVARFSDNRVEYYNSWPDCEKHVKCQKNVAFKGFKTRSEAEAWLGKFQDEGKTSDQIVSVYVDGSFTPKDAHAGWGWVAVDMDGETVLKEDCGLTLEPAESRNIDGELEATLQAISWAKGENIPVAIFHDYQGISSWALGLWKAKSPVARNYILKIKELNYPVQFVKVDGHSGDRWNDHADRLAKSPLGIEN